MQWGGWRVGTQWVDSPQPPSDVPLTQTLGNFTDMDSYYDMVDDIEALDMEGIMKVGREGRGGEGRGSWGRGGRAG